MYDAKAQKKYGEKIKTLGLKVFKDDFPKIEKHYKNKGFSSANGYLKYLLEKDLNNISDNTTDEKKILIKGMLDRLSDEQTEKVIDYIKLLLKWIPGEMIFNNCFFTLYKKDFYFLL